MNRAVGVLATGLFILAWMLIWGFLIHTYAATRPPGSRAELPAAGVNYNLG